MRNKNPAKRDWRIKFIRLLFGKGMQKSAGAILIHTHTHNGRAAHCRNEEMI